MSGSADAEFRGIGVLRRLVLLDVSPTLPYRATASPMCRGAVLSKLLELWMVVCGMFRVVRC